MERIIFFDPLPLKNQPNILTILDEKYIGKIFIKFKNNDPILLNQKHFDISSIYNKMDKTIISFTITYIYLHTYQQVVENYILYKVDFDSWEERKNAFEFLSDVFHNKNMLYLLIEFFIYHSQNITNFGEQFLVSEKRLRYDELECLSNKFHENYGITWICKLCQRINSNLDVEKPNINWLWKNRIRLFHFVTGYQAEKLVANEHNGAFIIRPSFLNPEQLIITCKVRERIKHIFFDQIEIIKNKISQDPEMLYGIIAASTYNLGNINPIIYMQKEDIFDKNDESYVIPRIMLLKQPLNT